MKAKQYWIGAAIIGIIIAFSISAMAGQNPATERYLTPEQTKAAVDALIEKHGESFRSRIESGVERAAFQWREDDGSAQEFVEFCVEQKKTHPKKLDGSKALIQRRRRIESVTNESYPP